VRLLCRAFRLGLTGELLDPSGLSAGLFSRLWHQPEQSKSAFECQPSENIIDEKRYVSATIPLKTIETAAINDCYK